jgi:TonB family protein
MIFQVLFNGLWQGALITAAGSAVASFLPKRDAATRYALWLTTLIAIAAIPIVTTLLRSPFAVHDLVANSTGAAHVTVRLLALSSRATHESVWLSAVIPWLLGLWALGAAFNVCRLILGLLRMERIAHNAQPDATMPAGVFVSDEIDVPLVAGVVRPRVLVPTDMNRTLDSTDLQRIVAHERAHVLRKDPAFNLLVRAIGALLFYDPFVHFVARKLADEREAACDDLVIAQTGRNLEYAACLATLAALRPRRIEVLSPNMLGFRRSLFSRIERLQSAQPRITIINRTALGGIVMLFAIIALALQTLTPALALTDPNSNVAQQPSASLVAASCAQPNVEAGVLTPQAPVFPQKLNRAGSAQAVVIITPSGRVAAARILHSSGNSGIDAAVLSAARHSTYSPKVARCVRVQGAYVFRVDFKPPA